MGRPACSSCCSVRVVVDKVGCVDDDYKAYYKVGGGGWKTSDGYDDYLKNAPVNIVVGIKVNYPIGSENEYTVDEIIVGVAPDPDRVRLSNDQVPNLLVDISEVKPVKRESGFRGLTAIKYVSSKSNSGEYASEVSCWNFPKVFGVDKISDLATDGNYAAGNPDYGVHIPALWTVTLGSGNEEIVVTRQITGKKVYVNYIKVPDIYNSFRGQQDGIGIGHDLEIKNELVVWTQKIHHNGKKIFDSYYWMTGKREERRYNYTDGRSPTLLTGTAWTENGGAKYQYLDFCLTFPFFMFYEDEDPASITISDDAGTSFNLGANRPGRSFSPTFLSPSLSYPRRGHTHYFDTGNNCNTARDIKDRDVQFYHADKKLFTKISVESKNFRVFNPNSNAGPEGVGRAITSAELADYEGDTLKKQDELIDTTYFQYTDNKIRNQADIPQIVAAQNESLGGIVSFPTGWPGLGQPGGGSIERLQFCTADNEYGIGNRTVFDPQAGRYVDVPRDSSAPDNGSLVFVSFRTNRGSDESGIDIIDEEGNLKDGVEVYHPVGSDHEYTIDEIIEKGPNLKPIKVKLSNGTVVNMSDIELLQDMFQYVMSKRVYNLQLSYLKSLGGDFYNPFKYRVTRIDVTNPDIDIDCIGDEIAGHPNMVDIEVGVNVLYPIGLDVNGNPVVSDEYTIAEITETGPDGQGGTRPIKVKLGNGPQPHISPEVDVSDIELINPNENPTYIKITQDYSFSEVMSKGSGTKSGWACLRQSPAPRVYDCPEEKREESLSWNLSEGSPATFELVKGPVPPSLIKPKSDVVVCTKIFFDKTEIPEPGKCSNYEGGRWLSGQRAYSTDRIFAGYDAENPVEGGWQISFLPLSRYGFHTTGSAHRKNPSETRDYYSLFFGYTIWNRKTILRTRYRPSLQIDVQQLPESGYLLGGDLNLVFYLQEINEWKREQI